MIKHITYFLILLFLIFYGINMLITDYLKMARNFDEIQNAKAGLVLGAKVNEDFLSHIFKDRLDAAILLYDNGKIEKILVSGDHGTKDYDEVNTAKKYLLSKNIKQEDIFLDHAGFDTYDSLYRAKKIFGITDVIIISQNFHLGRALYIAQNLGLNAQGFSADLHNYGSFIKNNIRESLARAKAFYDVNFNSLPKFLGPKIDINGDARQSWD